jgi:hypothetical protein
MNFHLTPMSSNSKMGFGVAVSTQDKKTCPDSCPLKANGCYADGGPLLRHWNEVSKGNRGKDWNGFLSDVESLPVGWKFRYSQAGDLPGINEKIDLEKIDLLSKVVKKRKLIAWTYTHKPLNKKNLDGIKNAIKDGFTINASADNLVEADKFKQKGIPVVVVLPKDSPDTVVTPNGHKVVVCPAQRNKKSNCSNCLLCQKSNRSVIVGFRAHGNGKNKATMVANG